jgi:hypothetical protein
MRTIQIALTVLHCVFATSMLVSCGSNGKITPMPQVSTVPLPTGLKGLAGAYTDSRYLTALWFGSHSHWMQPWRSFLETVPAQQFLDGVGVGFPTNDGKPDLTAQMLSKNGFSNVRIEIGWAQINFDDESKLVSATRLAEVLEACKKWKLRPLILLNVHQGAPAPVKFFDRIVTQDAAIGATQVTLESTAGLVVGFSGLSNLSDYWAAEALITAINGNTVTLSKPLPKAIAAGTKTPMATLKYRPFSKPGTADYVNTISGWNKYVDTVSSFAASKLGTTGTASLGFDLEIYNELTFGTKFLYINDYYEPDLDTYDGNSISMGLIPRCSQRLSTL